MSSKKTLEEMRPKTFINAAFGDLSAINLTMDCCEIEERRTIHVDAFSEKTQPYGHLTTTNAKRLRAWLDEALVWMESK